MVGVCARRGKRVARATGTRMPIFLLHSRNRSLIQDLMIVGETIKRLCSLQWHQSWIRPVGESLAHLAQRALEQGKSLLVARRFPQPQRHHGGEDWSTSQ